MRESYIEVNSYTYAGPQPGFIRSAETQEYYALIAVEAGEFDYGIGNHVGRASFGDLVYCPPGTLFKRKALGEITFHYFLFHSFLDSHRILTEIPVGKMSVTDVNRLSSTYTHLRKIWREYSSNSRITEYINHLLSDLLYLHELERQYTSERKKITDPLMQNAVSYFHRHLFNEISMQQISRNLGITPSELTRRFRMAYGITPIDYVTQRRLEEVKRLLLETGDTLDAIASRCGYENGSYLSRVFHSKIGVTPSYFRKKHRI